jgi:hypothetical protein
VALTTSDAGPGLPGVIVRLQVRLLPSPMTGWEDWLLSALHLRLVQETVVRPTNAPAGTSFGKTVRPSCREASVAVITPGRALPASVTVIVRTNGVPVRTAAGSR